VKELIQRLKGQPGKDIFVDGGAELVQELLRDKLIEELYLSIIPVLLGNGVRLFKDDRPQQLLKLVSAKHFNKGLVQLHYELNGR
jgi:dihydrofolate reductase